MKSRGSQLNRKNGRKSLERRSGSQNNRNKSQSKEKVAMSYQKPPTHEIIKVPITQPLKAVELALPDVRAKLHEPYLFR